MDRQSLIKTAEIRRPVLEYGDGVQGGEVWDSKTFVEDGVVKHAMAIKMTDELRTRFGDLMKPEDLREGFIIWEEIKELLIPITNNPSNPRIFALRDFNHQPTEFSLVRNNLINLVQRQKKENSELKKAVHAEQEKFRQYIEGTGYIKIEEIMRRVLGEEIAKLAAIMSRKA